MNCFLMIVQYIRSTNSSEFPGSKVLQEILLNTARLHFHLGEYRCNYANFIFSGMNIGKKNEIFRHLIMSS